VAEDVYAHFEGLVGECTDESHPGLKGWTQINSFSFGFGFHKKSPTPVGKGGTTGKKTLSQVQKDLDDTKAKVAAIGADKGKGGKDWGHSCGMDFEKVTFNKKADFMSKRLIEICHAGTLVPKVTIVMCRPGGEKKDEKTEFVRLLFEEVYLKTCVLNLAVEGLPTEDYSFEYNLIRLESVWTDNAIGNRRPDQPIAAEWDLRKMGDDQN
jgi:type VI protein secretion system component Hcp